ncbi:hypothetical protein O7983_000209 [Mycoplasmopsis felis]|uniref:hypothetical protein n=1 Tax=Mycoplasmopsis felis TaxID=33923 RepID=UPI003A4E335C
MYQKYKTNITKSQFYILMTLLALLTAVLLIWVLIPFGYGIKQTDEIKKLSKEEISELAKNISIKTLVSYFANTFIIIFFMIYILLLRNKLTAGYFFFSIWIIVFVTLIALPFYQGTDNLTNFQIVLGSLVSLVSGIITITLIVYTIQYYIKRKFSYYEWYKIHKGRSK